jgi:hypothetical protein
MVAIDVLTPRLLLAPASFPAAAPYTGLIHTMTDVGYPEAMPRLHEGKLAVNSR